MSLLETINIHISSNESYQRRNEECLAILVVTFVEIE